MAKDFKNLINDMKELVTNSARTAAVEIMNSLAEQGPAYSGQFSSAWYAVEPGQSPGGPRSAGNSIYKYDLRNVPRTKFRSGTYYEIVNGADYAPEALDLKEGRFQTQYDDAGNILEPLKTPVAVGRRTGPRRGQVTSGQGFAVSTAPLDWYVTYTSGGAMQRDLGNGVRIGFRQGPRGGNTPGTGFGR
jgi:hypothetical protein